MSDSNRKPPSDRGGGFDPEEAPLRSTDFPGCRAFHIPPEEIEDYEGRLEYWEARTGTAILCEPTSPHHELPGARLAGLTRLIAASRGAPIESYGTSDLVRFGTLQPFERLLQADQIVYIDPPSPDDLGSKVDVDGRFLPDVVLEVDHTTDARVRKLHFYQAWKFPEVWIEVPDIRAPSRPRSRKPGLTIHLLEGDGYRVARSSRAFPGWSAIEIHQAFNEPAMSHVTAETLHRVGQALATDPETGPDRDPWLRIHRDQCRAEGRAEGHATGRAEGIATGRAEARLSAALALLAVRGIETTEAALTDGLASFPDVGDDALMRAALACRSQEELLRLCRESSRPTGRS